MKKQTTPRSTIKFTAIAYMMIVIAVVALVNACNKSGNTANLSQVNAIQKTAAQPVPAQGKPMTQVVTVAIIRTADDGISTDVMFNENEEIFTIQDAVVIASLKDALSNNKPVQITFDPWKATVLSVSKATIQDAATLSSRQLIKSPATARKVDMASMSNDIIDNGVTPAGIAPINTTTTGLTNVIPDFETAQLMFNYIAHQCCAIPGPYAVDHCITFQYCQDGCYARAHKMCWIINNRYHYGTKKIFSFANAGNDKLCVQAQKWGGCCINWWYHVAPLVTIQTTTGPKAYVFDPAMFDQPVLLSTWLHAQANPACVPSGKVPHVTMINVQPTTSYSPSDNTGYAFDTDPLYTNTNSTLVSYKNLISCP